MNARGDKPKPINFRPTPADESYIERIKAVFPHMSTADSLRWALEDAANWAESYSAVRAKHRKRRPSPG